MKLISLNIEHDKHFDRFLPFLQQEKPDVVCLQEIFEADLPMIESALDMQSNYAPMVLYPSAERGLLSQGVAILSKHAMQDVRIDYYDTAGQLPGQIIPYNDDWDNVQKVLLSVFVTQDAESYRIGTTHFTWSPEGQANTAQRKDVQVLLSKLAIFDDILFCGDFNAPRGREIFHILAEQYRDNIPAEIISTLDPGLHRAPHIKYVVDGLFSTDGYEVSDLQLVPGVSDHCALKSSIQAAQSLRLAA